MADPSVAADAAATSSATLATLGNEADRSAGIGGLGDGAGGRGLPAEALEFCAEEVGIDIVPRFRHIALHFIAGDYGPFEPEVQVAVPLWLAIALRRRQKCTILLPEWMTVDALEATLKSEEEDRGSFSFIHFHYIEISAALFEVAAEDIEKASGASSDRLRTLLEDIQGVRHAKLHRGLQMLADKVAKEDDPITSVKLNNVAAVEIQTIRPFLAKALLRFRQLQKPLSAGGAGGGGGGGGAAAAAAVRRLAGGGGGGGGGGAGEGKSRKLRRFR